MIVDGKRLEYCLYKDSRGHYGESGQLFIAKDGKGRFCLVKTKPADVTNEFVAHKVAKLMGVPASNAVLIDNRGNIEVGITYENDFQRASVEKLRALPDEERHLSDFMAYMALKDLLLIDDNHQFAFSHGKLYSFDYAISFCVDDRTFGAMCILNDYHIPSTNFRNNFRFGNYCYKAIDLLECTSDESKKFLQDAYIDTLLRFCHTDPAKFQPIWNDLNAAFKPVIADFYRTCIEERMKTLNAMLVT